jgi:hypothetical protein
MKKHLHCIVSCLIYAVSLLYANLAMAQADIWSGGGANQN